MGSARTYFSYNSRVGLVTIAASDEGITSVQFGNTPIAGARCMPTPLTNDASTQIQEYFAGKRRSFDLPLDLDGSAFSHMVWEAIQSIPYGTSTTATELAEQIGKPESVRAVGSAISLAPVELLIPVHRIVDARGRARGTGKAAQRHHHLLAFERAQLAREKNAQ